MNSTSTSRATTRVTSLLKCFTHERTELSALEISRISKIPTATTYRILSGLTDSQFLERNSNTGKYMIGPELYFLGNLYINTASIYQAAEPVLDLLNNLTGEAIFMAILKRDEILFIMKKESRHALRLSRFVGDMVPAHATSLGKALLSELSDEDLDALYPVEQLKTITPKTVTTKAELKKQLAEIKKSGIAFDSEGSYEGSAGTASVIRDASGNAVAAMSLAAPLVRFTPAKIQLFSELIKRGSALVSYRLGYKKSDMSSIEDLRHWWEAVIK